MTDLKIVHPINMSTVRAVVEIGNSEEANRFLDQGWQLLSVIQGNARDPDEGSSLLYVLGWTKTIPAPYPEDPRHQEL